MAVGRAFRALTLLIFLIIVKSLQVHLVGKLDINVSSHQLCHLYLGKCISGYQISSFEIFNPKTKNGDVVAPISRAKQLASLHV